MVMTSNMYGSLADEPSAPPSSFPASAPAPRATDGTKAHGGWHRAGQRRRREEVGNNGGVAAEDGRARLLRMIPPAVVAAALVVVGFESLVAPRGGNGAEDALALARTARRAQHGAYASGSVNANGNADPNARSSSGSTLYFTGAATAVVHVAPWGVDSGSGEIDDPLGSLDAAKALVRSKRGIEDDDEEEEGGGWDEAGVRSYDFDPVDVVLSAGTHFLKPGTTLNLGPSDSNVRWIAKSHWDAEQEAIANGWTAGEEGEDQAYFPDGSDTTVSSGFQIPTDCWEKDESFPKNIFVYKVCCGH